MIGPFEAKTADRSKAFPLDRKWTIPEAVQLACTIEVTSPKIGNVHPGASFSDMNYGHFLDSAVAIRPVFERVSELSVGQIILGSVRATRARVGINTNLGTLLLFAPLAKAADRVSSSGATSVSGIMASQLHLAVKQVLADLQHDDSVAVYEAIRIAKPGGLGTTASHDIRDSAPVDLVGAMRQAATHDAVARQFANGFADVFNRLMPCLDEALVIHENIFEATCKLQLRWLAADLDGLIVRKSGPDTAIMVQSLAKKILQQPDPKLAKLQLRELDDYLRADGHRRNPGTTADLIAAALMVRLLISG